MKVYTKQNILSEVVEKLREHRKREDAPNPIVLGKDILRTCPSGEDLRDVIDPFTESIVLNEGYGYIQGLSTADKLTFFKLTAEQNEQWLSQKVSIRLIEYVPNDIKGFDAFEEELRRTYQVQNKKQWTPACGSSVAFSIVATIGMAIGTFMTSIVLPGIAWDITKGAFSKMWDAIGNLKQSNENLDLSSIDFRFNDITIKVGGAMADSYGKISVLFQRLQEGITYLHTHDIQTISSIAVPYVEEEGEEGIVITETIEQLKDNNYWWKVSYLNDCEACYFNPVTKEIVNAY